MPLCQTMLSQYAAGAVLRDFELAAYVIDLLP